MAMRGLFSFLSLILVAGACLLLLFIMLAGAINAAPVNNWYFLQVDTSTIPGAPAQSRWTFWNLEPGNVHPAFPFDPPSGRNFGTTEGVPEQFIGTRQFFYLTRFMFAFALIALFFSVCALLTGVMALCTRLGARLSGFLTSIAMLFQVATAALMTSAYVIGRNHFRANNQDASIGQYAFGFEWAGFACLFLATIFFCSCGSRKDEFDTKSSSGGFFKGKRSTSTRSKGSFINGDKQYA